MPRGPAALLVACALAWSVPVAAQIEQGPREERLAIDRAPYNQLYRSGALYLVKGRDYDPQWPLQGVRTAWLYTPGTADGTGRLEVRADYCLKELAFAPPSTYLQAIDLVAGNRVLVSIQDGLGALAVLDPILSPQPYNQTPFDTRQAANGVFVFPPRYYYNFPFPVYHLREDCASDRGGFDLAPVADTLAGLPEQTLQMRLRFSNGTVSTWGIDGRTIAALKQLLRVRLEFPSVLEEPSEE
jgi:hypothetical protein